MRDTRGMTVRLAPTLFLLSSLAFLGCSEPISFIRDGGGGDGGVGGPCAANTWTCRPGSQTAQQCNGRGGFFQEVECTALGRNCINGVGCAVCTPREQRCKEGEVNTTQVCADDGSAWIDGQVCNPTAGETCRGGRCLRRCDDLGSSYLGCEYWPTITLNTALDPRFTFGVVVANPNAYDVTVRIEGGALRMPRERTVAGGAVETFELPWVTALSGNGGVNCGMGGMPTMSSRAPGGAFHLTTTGPVAVYQFNPLEFASGARRTQCDFSFTNDASLLMPQNVLARQYIVATYKNVTFGGGGTSGGFVTIVGAQAEGQAMVRVRLTAPVFDPANRARMLMGEQMFTVERGEALQLVSSGRGDLTGTVIDSSVPVAVFAGHECAQIPEGNPACDHLEEQMFPTTTWGRTYAVSQFRDRSSTESSLIRVIAQRDGVTLTFDGITAPAACGRTLNQGQFCEFESAGNFKVSGSEPILVVEFMRGLGPNPMCQIGIDGTVPMSPMCVGDPAMVLTVPVDQYRGDYNFLIPSTYQRNYVNVTAAPGAMIMLDGRAISGTAVPTGNGLVTYFLDITPGSHSIRSANPVVERFGIKVYGVASYTSYAYPGGLDLAPISPPG